MSYESQRFPAWLQKMRRPHKTYKELLAESYGREKARKLLEMTKLSGSLARLKGLKMDYSVWRDTAPSKANPSPVEEDL